MSPRPLGQRSLCFSAALQSGATVWALVGACPTALLEEGDSYPAKFPPKIRPCRQLSAVCDKTHGKIFFFTCTSKTGPVLGNAGRASSVGSASHSTEPSTADLGGSGNLPLMWSWVLAHQSSPVCPFLLVCFSWLFLTRTGNRSSFPCMV